MKLIAVFALAAVLSQPQPSVAQSPYRSPIVLAHQPTPTTSPFVARHAVRYAASPQPSYATASPASFSAPAVVTYSPAQQTAAPHTVYRPTTVVANPVDCSPAPAIYTARPVYAAPAIPPGYYPGRGIIGQQKLYATGQPIRNALRFLTF
jgi:hypothetical protein